MGARNGFYGEQYEKEYDVKSVQVIVRQFYSLFFLGLLVVVLHGCDSDHKKKCEWTLEPDTRPERLGKMPDGYFPACARNRTVNKQDCRLAVPLKFAKAVESKKFRYVDLKVKSTGLPRIVTSIDLCD